MRIRESSLLVISNVILASLSVLSACGGDGDSWVRESVDPDSVRVVENGPYPREWNGSLPVLCLEDETVVGHSSPTGAFRGCRSGATTYGGAIRPPTAPPC